MKTAPVVFLIGTRWFGVLGPCRQIISELEARGVRVMVFGQEDAHYGRYHNGRTRLVRIFMRRSYVTFLHDFIDIVRLVGFAMRYRPVAIHSFNPKPSLLAYVVALVRPRAVFIIGVTGLGNTFIRAKRLEPVITSALRLATKRADFVFFQNPDDRELFASRKLGDPGKYLIFTGPGVDLDEFDYRLKPVRPASSPVRIVCVSRLIWQKGIREYVEAARAIKGSHGDRVEFLLIGDFDVQHPDCVDEAYIDTAVSDGTIEHTRWTDSLPGILATCDIAVLHSYREGAPRAILEAAAMKLPTVGSDAIGVRELVVDGVTGILTELKSVEGVRSALLELIEDPVKRRTYGENAYEMIAVPFSLTNASRAQLRMYDDINDR